MSNTNERATTIADILGTAVNYGKQATARVTNTVSTTISSPETANGILQLAFYLILYAFILFLVLLVIHFTITPVFRFMPGSKGFIPVTAFNDSGVYWNSKQPPAPLSKAPIDGDSLSSYPFLNNFSFSVDLFIRKLTDTNATNRIILMKAPNSGPSNSKISGTLSDSDLNALCANHSSTTNTISDLSQSSTKISELINKVSMIMYLTEVNDLVVSFFSPNKSGILTTYSSKPIQNIPLYEPFRISVVVEERLFTLYLNGKQVFQRIIPDKISHPSGVQKFYSPPSWADLPTKTVFLQNLILNPRVISYDEVVEAQPALALADNFGASQESTGNGTC